MKLPLFTQPRFGVSAQRGDVAPTSGGNVTPSQMTPMANCQTRCFQGWCRQCCPGSPCVNYRDPSYR